MPPTSPPTPTQALCPSPSPLPESPESADRAEEVGADASAAAAGGPVPAPQRQRTAPGEAAPGGAEVPRCFRTRKGQTDAAHMDALDMLGGWTVFSLREGKGKPTHFASVETLLPFLRFAQSIQKRPTHFMPAMNIRPSPSTRTPCSWWSSMRPGSSSLVGQGGSPKTFWPSCSLGLFMF